jgi:hypothetical protein
MVLPPLPKNPVVRWTVTRRLLFSIVHTLLKEESVVLLTATAPTILTEINHAARAAKGNPNLTVLRKHMIRGFERKRPLALRFAAHEDVISF